MNKIKRRFSKNNTIDKPLARQMRIKGEKTQIIDIRNRKGDITADSIDNKMIRKYCEQHMPISVTSCMK